MTIVDTTFDDEGGLRSRRFYQGKMKQKRPRAQILDSGDHESTTSLNKKVKNSFYREQENIQDILFSCYNCSH